MIIKELLDKQRELDMYIFKEKGLGDPYDKKWIESRKLALLVEIGELANATRCFKYWSNKGPEPKERILDEMADCLHFILSLLNYDYESYAVETTLNEHFLRSNNKNLISKFNRMYYWTVTGEYGMVLLQLGYICETLGFTAQDLELAYLKKHEENYKRQQEGY